MNKLLLILAALIFIGTGTFYAFSVLDTASDLIENSTEVDEITREPGEYLGENLTAYGYYIPGTVSKAPADYSLVGENSSIYITECPETERLGEKVFVNGYLEKVEHKTMVSTPKIREGSEIELYENTTSLVFRCKTILG